MSPKEKAFRQMSLYCRLRDAIEWNRLHSVDISDIQPKMLLVKCCSCTKIGSWFYNMQAGHFIARGSRGQSGVFYDERNVHAQCGECNGFKQGNALGYLDFMKDRYGELVINELRVLDAQVKSYSSLECLKYEIMYREMYKDLLKEF